MPMGETLAPRRLQSKNISALKCSVLGMQPLMAAWPGPLESWATKILDVAPALYPQMMTEEWP